MSPNTNDAPVARESVWDYPRPPRIEKSTQHIEIVFHNVVVADTRRAIRILETTHPPNYYIPPEDVRMELLLPSARRSFCEWKGNAAYYSLALEGKLYRDVAWYYEHPSAKYVALQNYLSFYPGKADACYVDGERVRPEAGDFYGGWITDNISLDRTST